LPRFLEKKFFNHKEFEKSLMFPPTSTILHRALARPQEKNVQISLERTTLVVPSTNLAYRQAGPCLPAGR